MFSIIAAIGKNRELGNKGGLCFQLKGDMKFFKDTTMGHKVLMGTRTMESLPHGPLKGRNNYVLTNQPVDFPDVEEIHSIEEALELFGAGEEEVFICGGTSVYAQFLPYADKLYLTEIEADAEADVFFPEFDKANYEREVLEKKEENGTKYSFVLYKKKEPAMV